MDRRTPPICAAEVRRRLIAQSILRHLRSHQALPDDILASLCKVPLHEATEARRRLRRYGLVTRGKVHVIGSDGGRVVSAVAWRLS